MGVALVLLTGALVGVTALFWARRRGGDEPYHCFRCPGCGQKVRYLASRAGKSALCPRCRRCCVLPATPRERAGREYPGAAERVAVGRVLRRPTRLTTAGGPGRAGRG
jgi:hypothetical protein